MKYRNPSRINKNISVIGFGAWQLGNPEFFGPMEDDVAIQLVHRALEEGVNLFDTAPGYGSGNSERLLGLALKDHRNTVFINTKFGHTADGRTDFSVDALDESIQASLSRLQTDYLDGLILHNPGRELLDGDQAIYQKLKEYKQQGIVRHFGVSIDSLEELDIVLHHNNVDIIELMFNIIHQSPKALFAEVEKQGILLMIKVPLDSGWLSGKYTANTVHTGIRSRWTRETIQTRLEIVNRIKAIVGKDDIAQDSLRFILAQVGVTAVIPGVRNEHQLRSNVEAQTSKMSNDTILELETLYEEFIKHQHTPW